MYICNSKFLGLTTNMIKIFFYNKLCFTEGYVDIEDILDLHEASAYTLEDVERVVRRDRKGRFSIKTDGIVKMIRATQGHTIKVY